MTSDAALAAMRDFVLANETNLKTGCLIHEAFDSVRDKLVSDLARRIGEKLSGIDDQWEVANSLADNPAGLYEKILWFPRSWSKDYGWGVCLQTSRAGARGVILGFCAPSKDIADREPRYPAMPEETRNRIAVVVGKAITFATPRSEPWWPSYGVLPPDIYDWSKSSALSKIYFALHRGGDADLVGGEPFDEFLVAIFLAIKQQVEPIVRDPITPVPE